MWSEWCFRILNAVKIEYNANESYKWANYLLEKTKYNNIRHQNHNISMNHSS